MPLDPTPVPIGPEFRVGTIGQNQREADLAALSNGGFVATWQAPDPSGDGTSDVFAQRYTASGAPAGGEFRVNGVTVGHQDAPAVAALVDGGFVVAWQTPEPRWPEYRDVLARRYAADGTPAGNEFVVAGGGREDESSPTVVATAGGGFSVIWREFHPGYGDPYGSTGRSYGSLVGQGFGADGKAKGGSFRADGGFLRSDNGGAEAAALPNGDFVVAWHSAGGHAPSGGADHDVYSRHFSATGVAVGGADRPNRNVGGDQSAPDVATLSDGGVVVVWSGPDPSGAGGGDIFGRRSGTDGEFRVNGAVAGSQGAPAAASLADGGFVVVWWSFDPSGAGGNGIFGRRFDANNGLVGDEFTVHEAAPGDLTAAPEVVGLEDGAFVVTWHGADGIRARLFDGSAAPPLPSVPAPEPGPAALAARASIGANASSKLSENGIFGVEEVHFFFTVTLDTASSTPQSVRWQVGGRGPRPADASDFADGVLPAGEVVFLAGETGKGITVRVVNDSFIEADETFAVSLRALSSGVAVSADGSAAAATIFDDDRRASASREDAAQVVRLYDAALDRLPDQGGFEFWVGALGKGEALSSLASGFLASEEFAARFAGASTDNTAFVDGLYRNVLGRAGEAEGRAFWGDSLAKGCSRAELLAAFSESAEHVVLTAARVGDGSDLALV